MEPRISIQLSTIPRTSNWGCRTQCCPVGRLGFAIGRCTPTPRPFCVTLSRREYRSGITQHQLDTRPHSTNYYQAMRWMVFPYITRFLPGASFPALGSPAWSEFPALVSFHSSPNGNFMGNVRGFNPLELYGTRGISFTLNVLFQEMVVPLECRCRLLAQLCQ